MEKAINGDNTDLRAVILEYRINDNKYTAFLQELLDCENIQAMVEKYETETNEFKAADVGGSLPNRMGKFNFLNRPYIFLKLLIVLYHVLE